MKASERIHVGFVSLVNRFPLQINLILAMIGVLAGLAVCTADAVGLVLTLLLPGALAALCWWHAGNVDTSDETEFGASFDALQAERERLALVQRKAADNERAKRAQDAFIGYERRASVLGRRPGHEV